MALRFTPGPGTLWMCDFATGFKPPEMTKVRPVVVISRAPKREKGHCTVVPLSTVEPIPLERVHREMSPESLPAGIQERTWAKCDMLCTVALHRLRRVGGTRGTTRVIQADLDAIRECVLARLSLGLDKT